MKYLFFKLNLILTSLIFLNSHILELNLLSNALKEHDARCLDGSAPGYYWKQGFGSGSDKFLIFFEGGGACLGKTQEEVYDSCLKRSKTDLGSSKNWKQTKEMVGIFSFNTTINPIFNNWNMVHINYCDGTAYFTYMKDPVVLASGEKIYFKGRKIVDAVIEDLKNRRNLFDSSEVILSGCSAGGRGAYYHVDYIRSLLPQNIIFRAIPDAGIWFDVPNIYNQDILVEQVKGIFYSTNMTANVHQNCALKYPNQENAWKCYMAKYFLDTIQTPMFIINSQYDKYQMVTTLNLDCSPPKQNCQNNSLNRFLDLKNQLYDVLQQNNIFQNQKDGLWTESCILHCHTINQNIWNSDNWKIPANNGKKIQDALFNWMNNVDEPQRYKYFDQSGWPNNKPCSYNDSY